MRPSHPQLFKIIGKESAPALPGGGNGTGPGREVEAWRRGGRAGVASWGVTGSVCEQPPETRRPDQCKVGAWGPETPSAGLPCPLRQGDRPGSSGGSQLPPPGRGPGDAPPSRSQTRRPVRSRDGLPAPPQQLGFPQRPERVLTPPRVCPLRPYFPEAPPTPGPRRPRPHSPPPLRPSCCLRCTVGGGTPHLAPHPFRLCDQW